MRERHFSCIVIGVSAGGLNALTSLFKSLPADFPVPIAVVQHEKADSGDLLAEILDHRTALSVRTAEEKEKLKDGVVYICPADYHLLIEENKTLSFSAEPKVNFARPSIDVLFETAAIAFGEELIAIILTGASSDGSMGLAQVMKCGGYSIIQDSATAYSSYMPEAALRACPDVDDILPLQEISSRLISLCMKGSCDDK